MSLIIDLWSSLMEKIINDAIIPMVNEGLLSINKIHDLIYIRDFIDRVSTNMYTGEKTVEKLENMYGVRPDIITWGDYFQSEAASSLIGVSDEDLKHFVSVIKFDIMSCNEIFPGKESEFFDWIDEQYYKTIDADMDSADVEEALQLKIMKEYYVELGIVDKFTPAEKSWYSSYYEAVAI